MNTKVKILFIFLVLILSLKNNAQNLDFDKPCYCINETDGNPNYLYQFSNSTNGWQQIGNEILQAENLEGIALNPVNNEIYVSLLDNFGYIGFYEDDFGNRNAYYGSIDYINSKQPISGLLGEIVINNVDGLSYNPYTNMLWATQRIRGLDNNSRDILFQIDPETAQVIKGVFQNGHDYVPIVAAERSGNILRDVEDIAIHPFTNELYVIHNQDITENTAYLPGVISILNKTTGLIESLPFGTNYLNDNLEGLGFSKYGELFATIGDTGGATSYMKFCDLKNRTYTNVNIIDRNLPNANGDFEAFDCMNGINDLALTIEVVPFTSPLKSGDKIFIDYTIYNQGDIPCDEYKLAFSHSDELSMTVPTYGIVDINNPILPGEIVTRRLPLQFKVESPTTSFVSIYGEIVQSTFVDIKTSVANKTIYLPDIDSTPNNGTTVDEDDQFEVKFRIINPADTYTAVWPGDADANGIVNNTDVLYIGLAEGNAGLSRENASNNWQQQMATDWPESVFDINNKHQDTNGDGIINAQDLQTVEENYGKTNFNGNTVYPTENAGVFKLYQTSFPGDLPIEYDLVLDVEGEVLVHGIKGSIDLSGYFADNDDELIISTQTSVLEPELIFTNYNPDTKIFEYALSRTDGEAKTVKKGDRLMRVIGVAEEIFDGGNQPVLELTNGGIMGGDGQLHTIGNATLQTNTGKTPAASAGLNFNIITTPSTCSRPGTAEIDMLNNNMGNFEYVWSNGMKSSKIDNLLNGVYTVSIIKSFNAITDNATIHIEGIAETESQIWLSKKLLENEKYVANNIIELNNGLEVPKDVSVEFSIGNCYD